MPAIPYRIDDGDFTIAEQNGYATASHPFAGKGDTQTFIMVVPMRIDARYYRPPESMQQREFELGTGYLVDLDRTSLVGAELYEYNEIYASVPLKREEYGGVSYPIGAASLLNDTWIWESVDGLYVYEYSLFKPLPPLTFASEYASGRTVGSGVGGRNPGYYIPPNGTTGKTTTAARNRAYAIYPTGTYSAVRGLAENSTSRIWMGKIYERLAIYGTMPVFIPTP